jgi:CPA1 family monovalent cation:H+ antiporter
VKRLGVRADTEREKESEKQLAVRAAKAAIRRLKEIDGAEALPEDISERMLRRAFDIGLRLSPGTAEEERRGPHTNRVRRTKRVRQIQGEMLSAAPGAGVSAAACRARGA